MLDAGLGATGAAAAAAAFPCGGGGGYLDSSCLTPRRCVLASQSDDTISTLPQLAAWLWRQEKTNPGGWLLQFQE